MFVGNRITENFPSTPHDIDQIGILSAQRQVFLRIVFRYTISCGVIAMLKVKGTLIVGRFVLDG